MPAAVRECLRQRHRESLDLALWVRGVVLEAEPDLDERVYDGWDGIGYRHPDAGYVCAIYPREGGVRLLFEHGVRLEDPTVCPRATAARPAMSFCVLPTIVSRGRSAASYGTRLRSGSSAAEHIPRRPSLCSPHRAR